MLKFLAVLEGLAFLFLSLLHLYWALGGDWAFLKGLPTNERGQYILNPGKIDSALVAVVLALIAIYYLNLAFHFFHLPLWLQDYAGYGVALIFLLRAIGDLKYVGFFKKVKGTPFGKRDSSFYSPLCLLLSLIAFFLSLIQY